MSEYRVELVYRDGHRSPYGHASEKTPELVEWRNRLRRSHRDVRKGLANVCIRRVGES